MSEQKTIKLVKAWRLHEEGKVLTLNAPIADLLIQNRRAVLVRPPLKKQPVK